MPNMDIGEYNLHYIWTESYLTALTLELTLPMGMHTEHTLVDMLSPFQPISIYTEPLGIL